MPDSVSKGSTKKFNPVTLQIKDSKYKEPFTNFAVEEIHDVVPYYAVMSVCFFFAQIIFAVQKK